jgi:hypothetical protein
VPVRVFVRTPVETVQLIVQHPREKQAQLPEAWGKGLREPQYCSFIGRIYCSGALNSATVRGNGRHRLDSKFGSVEDNVFNWLLHGDKDRFFASESKRFEIRGKPDLIAFWANCVRELVGLGIDHD